MLVGKKLLDNLLEVGPYLKEIFGKDLTVWISDTDKLIGNFPGDSIVIQVTDVVLGQDDPMRYAMKKRECIHTNVPQKLFGIPFKEVDSPIYDENHRVIGCISIGVSQEQEVKIAGMSEEINKTVETISDSSKQIAMSAEDIRKSEEQLKENINEIKQKTKNIGKVLLFTKGIADQTNLLGVNAAIQAAQAGAYGKGFMVVADEVRKLSLESMKIAKDIETLITEIEKTIHITLSSSEMAYRKTEDQVMATKEVERKIDDLKKISENLMEISKEV